MGWSLQTEFNPKRMQISVGALECCTEHLEIADPFQQGSEARKQELDLHHGNPPAASQQNIHAAKAASARIPH